MCARPDSEAAAIADALGPCWGGAEVAVVLGSGLGAGVAPMETRESVPFEDVPGVTACGVPGHAGRLMRGSLAGTECVFFQGRRHLYEGVPATVAALPARLGAALGARLLVCCSSVGSVDPALAVGTWVFFEDHLNLMGRNPLEGVADEQGPAFVDLSRTYRVDLFEDLSRGLQGRVRGPVRGILAAFCGPTYETPAEVRMARLLGAAVVGMSTVPEVVWARYLGMDVVAWGRVANPAAGVSTHPIAHAEVLRESESGGVEAAEVVEQSVRAWRRAGSHG